MYISKLRLWNFRKYGSLEPIDIDKPNLEIPFKNGMNILIGENDSGKTSILDAIKLVLKTHAYEWIRVEESDFFMNENGVANSIRVEIEFSGITDEEASNFIEWCGWVNEKIEEEDGKIVEKPRPKLIVIYQADLRDGRIVPSEIRAGMDGHGHPMSWEARELLKCTYLKPLRDADRELTAGRGSRLSQILKEHKLLKEEGKEFEEIFDKATEKISGKFKDKTSTYYNQIKKVIDSFLQEFVTESIESRIDLGQAKLSNILERLSLGVLDNNNLGLGTMNRLFMAAELLHLKRDVYHDLKLCLIEELEAHLHPQAQLKVVNQLKRIENIQYILSSHSPNITSQANLEDIIICKNNNVFPLGEKYTKLEERSYKYLERFLDVTKSNLFFSKGNIIVEGWSEEILLPVVAKKMGFDLIKREVSIINVASTAYLHFAKIFLREEGENINVPISIVTDKDIKPNDEGVFEPEEESDRDKTRIENLIKLQKDLETSDIRLYLAKEWTLEWCLFKSEVFSELFKTAVSNVHTGTEEFKKNTDDEFKNSFQSKFIQKLAKRGSSPLNKVAIANEFALLLEGSSEITNEQLEKDIYLKYLIEAIKHVCEYDN